MIFPRKTPDDPPTAEYITVPADVRAELIPIGEEISRIEESARHSSQVQFEAAKSWHYWNLFLGVPASIFGLFTGGAAFTEALPSWAIGTGALIGAALAGAMTVLGAERRATRAKTCANTFHDIQDDARRLLTIDLTSMDTDEAHAALTSLCDRYKETRQTTDAPARRFYTRALRNLREGGQQFAIDAAKSKRDDPTPATETTPAESAEATETTPAESAEAIGADSANPNKEN
jgi:hypothetical protein